LKKYLITGFSGFVSKHLLEYLSSIGEEYEIIGIARSQEEIPHYKNLHIKSYHLDLKSSSVVKEVITSVQPDYIIHLASDSSVAYSWQNPLESFQNNTNIFLNIVEAVRAASIKCRILSVGSSEEYGIVRSENLPLREDHPLNPISPYAVARVSQEMLSRIYVSGFGLDIVITRSFNHIGPGQKDSFVISSFAKQIAERKLKGNKQLIRVGDVTITRDFLDVRDVVMAYMSLLEKGISGEVYNICSGCGNSLEELLKRMLKIADADIRYEVAKELIRPSDNPIIIGTNDKLRNATGWQQQVTLDTSLSDILNYWYNKV
jgi:GDP-4-dehydro-6-deoxy-D-mannose reductase